ncbi:MAG TPA: TldD/PmbA family protein, partial [Nitrospiria bacterium]|nr:TldD/PmbA family protein [Nitrospiria bacterium]
MDFQPAIAESLLRQAKAKGATGGDILVVEGNAFEVQVRLGEIEKISNARGKALGLRLFFGNRSALTSTSDFSKVSLDQILEDTCTLAKLAASDDFSVGLPTLEECAQRPPDLGLHDPAAERLTMEERIGMAKEVEASALSEDPRITNSEGGEFSNSQSSILYANSDGFLGQYQTSLASLSSVPIATENGRMQRDFWYSTSRRFDRLESPAAVGKKAAQRVLRRMGARRVATQKVPIVFDPEMAAAFLGHLAGALSGYALYKGASFLAGKLGETIASPLLTVYDDATIPSALGSKPFDAEGLASRKNTIIEGGVLKSYLLDRYSARKLGLASTGNAARGVEDAPGVSPTNFFIPPGECSPMEIIRSIRKGLYVTELIGFGVNMVTGDYSRGAVGIWIEEGEFAYPVEEITVAGSLQEMLMGIEMVGNDLALNRRIAAP